MNLPRVRNTVSYQTFCQEVEGKSFAFDGDSLRLLRVVQLQLYREERLTGDDQRDLAHMLGLILDGRIDLDKLLNRKDEP